MMELFDGVEILFELISEFVYNKAFSKEKTWLQRLGYIIVYYVLLLSVSIGLLWFGIKMMEIRQFLIGGFCGLIVLLTLFLMIYPLVTKK